MKYSQINKNMSTEELQKKLMMNLIGIAVIILVVVLSLFVFAPKIGFLFGLVSKHRNEEGYIPTSKIAIPTFRDVPIAYNKSTITLSGYAQPGVNVKLYVNGPEKASSTAASDGVFTFSDVSLNEGKNTLYAKAEDGKGNSSDNTVVFFIDYDKSFPKIEDLSPSDGSTVRNLDKRINITGKTNEKAVILVNGKTAVQKEDFSFEFLLGVDEGNVKIKVEATDIAGNKTEKEITVKYEKRSV